MEREGMGAPTIGELLETQRIKRGIRSQRALSRLLGWSPPDAHRYISGEILPGPDRLPAIARFVGMPIAELRARHKAEEETRRSRPKRDLGAEVAALKVRVEAHLAEFEGLAADYRNVLATIAQLVEELRELREQNEALRASQSAAPSSPRRLPRRPR